MKTGDRIKFIRNFRGMTMKELGRRAGFNPAHPDVLVSHYESNIKAPRTENLLNIAEALNVSPHAIDVPDLDSHLGMIHTFFAMEDHFGFYIDRLPDGEPVIRLRHGQTGTRRVMRDAFEAWLEEAEKYRSGAITAAEYDEWRYRFPEFCEGFRDAPMSRLKGDNENRIQMKLREQYRNTPKEE